MSAIRKTCQQLAILVWLAIALTGCVQYDATINFFSFNSGELIQHVTLDQQFYQLNSSAVRAWMQSIEQRTKILHGQIHKISDRELSVVIPFRTGDALVKNFNQFFAGDQQLLSSQLGITTNNFLLASRQHLTYDLDLRSLTADSNLTGGIAGQPAVDLKFALNVPDLPLHLNHSRHWQLQLGQVHHLSTEFWLPNPLGIGGVLIALLVALGYFIKSKF